MAYNLRLLQYILHEWHIHQESGQAKSSYKAHKQQAWTQCLIDAKRHQATETKSDDVTKMCEITGYGIG